MAMNARENDFKITSKSSQQQTWTWSPGLAMRVLLPSLQFLAPVMQSQQGEPTVPCGQNGEGELQAWI